MPHFCSPEHPPSHVPLAPAWCSFTVALLILVALASAAWASDAAPVASDIVPPPQEILRPPAEAPVALPPPSLASNLQDAASAGLIYLSNSIDTFFVDPSVDETYNRTRLRLRGGVEYSKGGELNFLPRLSLNFDLPQTRQRFNLFFNRDHEEGEEQASTLLGLGREDEFKFNLKSGLRYIISQSPGHHLQVQIGSKLVPDVEPFTELRGKLIIPLNSWLFQPTQFLFWREAEKFGETSRLDFDHPISDDARVRWRFEGTFSQTSDGYVYLVETSYARQLKSNRGFQMALLTQCRTRPDHDVITYQASIDWRQLIYQDWLYYETGTRLTFAEDDNFKVTPAVSVLLEANFGNFTRH